MNSAFRRSSPLVRAGSASGQSLLEFALVLPLLLVVVLGVVETGYALLDAHVVTKIGREGSNLISRDTTLLDAANAMRQMTTGPVNFDDGSSKLIFSVIMAGPTPGTTNFNKAILYQRYEFGTYPGQSAFAAAGNGSYGGAPDYRAVNPDTDASLQIVNCPPNLLSGPGSIAYVTEIYSRHILITPLDGLGVHLPTTMYSVAYF
jgi:hypothetical protein